ncbi:oxidoreductase [Sporolactobacillus sp. CPB3-1]|uniref:Oxidoreductase n=1 Tax=Sporolactobacillus mangiferae TaxID=2940498 RepID=A0ABT0MD98_9BACL|nr:oxidoreductase [Sporolactobacillus mangiferae]MCL1632852.1 oxidoreductase [Sporolactobacillus mangiferae]
MKKVWFITGASRGFGLSLSRELIRLGYPVVVTARRVETVSELAEGKDQVLALPLDVTDQAQVRSTLQKALNHFGRIDVLVNNAGFGYFGAIEEADEEAVRQLFETNFWGLSDLTRAVLPTFRSQGSGHFVNISSIAGLSSAPALGYYNASKFAVEGFSQALAQEVGPLGIKVTLVEPGPFRTDWAGSSAPERQVKITDYDATAGEKVKQLRNNSGKQPGSPDLAAKAIIKAVEAENSPLHLPLGKGTVPRALQQFDDVRKDFEEWQEAASHVDFGDDAFWN